MTGAIGYYVHHQGSGHLHRAQTLGEALRGAGHRVTGLSTLPRPASWVGEWVELPPDDAEGTPLDATAGGALHWAPLHQGGVRRRAAAVSAWIQRAHPSLVVSDVSQELTALARLHGVPVVSVLLPGQRTDAAHQLGFRLSERLVAFWPQAAGQMSPDLSPEAAGKLVAVGALSRFAPTAAARPDRRLAVVMGGTGGAGWSHHDVEVLQRAAPDWEVAHLGRGEGQTWAADPWPLLCAARVVVTHAGQNAVAEVASARVPAVVVPAERPFDEQVTTAAQLAAGGWPVVVADRLAEGEALLELAAGLDGRAWSSWCDGRAAQRFVRVVEDIVGPGVERVVA